MSRINAEIRTRYDVDTFVKQRCFGRLMKILKSVDAGRRLSEEDLVWLLGEIHMETGNYSLGQDWYAKAVERGASTDSVDQDLGNIFFRADPAKQLEMRAFLLSDDPVRYAWAKQRVRPSKRGA